MTENAKCFKCNDCADFSSFLFARNFQRKVKVNWQVGPPAIKQNLRNWGLSAPGDSGPDRELERMLVSREQTSVVSQSLMDSQGVWI
jgi:hypothetical protein